MYKFFCRSLLYLSFFLLPALSVLAAEPPQLISVNPFHGSATGGTVVLLTGSNFVDGVTVMFGDAQADTTFINSTTIKAVTPSHDKIETVDITVKNPDGQTSILKNVFAYTTIFVPPPAITSIDPARGPTAGGTEVTILGSGFLQSDFVSIGSHKAVILSMSSNEIKAKTPPHAAGKVNVVVSTPGEDLTSTLRNGFTYFDETTLSTQILTPNGTEILSAGGLPYVITWNTISSDKAVVKLELSLDGGITFNKVLFSGIPPKESSFTFIIPSDIKTKKGRIRITVEDNGKTISDVSDKDFSIVKSPTITKLSPSSTTVSKEVLKLKIQGLLFKKKSVIEINGNPIPTVMKSSNLIIAKTVDQSNAGVFRVRVRNPDGSVSAESQLTIK